jgi:uncharacterized repeat protein (TIGR03803 family)
LFYETVNSNMHKARRSTLVVSLLLLTLSRIWALEPEVVYSFSSGLVGPVSPSSLIQGPDGNLYGTTTDASSVESGGTSGEVIRITTNGVLTILATIDGPSDGYPVTPNGLVLGPDGNFYGTTFLGGPAGVGTVFKVSTNGVLTTLASFNGSNGANPIGTLVLGLEGNFYGATERGGANNVGTVFRITPGGALTTLVSLTTTDGDGANGGVALDWEGSLYGTTYDINGHGTVYRVTTNGILTTVVSFNGTNGGNANQLLLGPDGNFYGTTTGGGSANNGTIFRLTTNGALTTLLSFAGTNGSGPSTGLILGSDGNLYGTTCCGGSGAGNDGTVFLVTTNGTLTTLASFSTGTGTGGKPSGLTFGPDGALYGTTSPDYIGAGAGYGTIFKIPTKGALTTLLSFNPTFKEASPRADLLSGNDGRLYGTTELGGDTNAGTVFAVTTNGVLTRLGSFTGANGTSPRAGLALGNDGRLYGTTAGGGDFNAGTVFRVDSNSLLTTLASFSGTNGFYLPQTDLVLGLDGNFYGTTSYGAVYRVTPSGTLTKLASINGSDSWNPAVGLALASDGSFYGTISTGGTGSGKVFRITTNGVVTTLVTFNGTNGAAPLAALVLGPDGNFYGTTSAG